MWRSLLLLAIALLLNACANGANGGQNTNGQAGDGQSGLLAVDHVEVQIAESFPPQVFMRVTGTLPDSCTTLGEIRQEREDNTIEVTITTNRPEDAACAMVIQPVEETVRLEGTFSAGEYVVCVNGVERTFQV